MPKNTNENDVLSKLKYIGLDLENVPNFLSNAKRFEYKPLKSIEDNEYKIYKYIPISKIQILLTPCNRLNTIAEKYAKADSISSYLDSKSEENILKYTNFLKMLREVEISKIEEIEEEQKKLQKQIPFSVKYKGNYLWQIYYSDIADMYFMLVPTEDLEYATFFYLLKKQIELKQNKKEEYIFVPISHEEYSGKLLKKSQISDLEKYLWEFTKDWPITYEIYEKSGESFLQIVGQVNVYENIQSEYKITLKTKEEAEKYYKFIKALFILEVELPQYYSFKVKIDAKGALQFEYQKKKITYDTLMQMLVKEYQKAKEKIEELSQKRNKLERELKELQKESIEKEQEYLSKERLIATYLECKKTFFGKVKYFFKAKKIKKNLKTKIEQEEKKQTEEVIEQQNETESVKFIDKEYYTIEDIIEISKELDNISQIVKNLELDSEAQRRKIQSFSKKIENASLYIEEIDKHEKSIFEFWKFANKDEQSLLQAPQEENIKENKQLEKIFDYEEDLEEIGIMADKKQRNILTKEETDAIFITTTELLQVLNDYENEEEFTKSLNDLKTQAEEERILFQQENFDLFGNVAGDSTKIQLLAGKKHREVAKDKFKILDITKNLTLDEYKDKMLEILKQIYNVFEKVSSPISIPIYCTADEEINKESMQMCYVKPEEAILEKSGEKQIELYRFNVKKKMPVIYFTNSMYYDNHNKTLPLGMNVSSKCLINLSQYDLTLKQKEDFRITNLEDEFKVKTIKVNVYEYEIRKKEEK